MQLFTQVHGDLFGCPEGASLGHCVARDFHMGAGIAVAFRKQFGRVQELHEQRVKVPGLAVLEDDGRFIYYLVTKERSNGKPTYESLQGSLDLMLEHAVANGVPHICIPRIGCGLDRLQWSKVWPMIKQTFKDSNIRITAYYL